ncbi:MAG: hypothetical protein SFY67_01335 [Candidatus Melainabacteria bacterium]|nr:hypothetical protein [Candidatus Melainabacteria bacterium]
MPEENNDINTRKLQEKFAFTTGYILMVLLALCFIFMGPLYRPYESKSFTKLVNQLNQLSADAEKASGS